MERVTSLQPESVNLSAVALDDAVRLAAMLGMALDRKRASTQPVADLRRYSAGVGLGREGGFTAFRLDNELVAMTHTTIAGRNLELDALARLPGVRERGLGSQALTFTLALAAENGQKKVGLFTPPRNIPFYTNHGFLIDDEPFDEDMAETRMYQSV